MVFVKQCPVCFKELNWKHRQSYSRHVVNCGKKDYKCFGCDKSFNRQDSLKRHQLICKCKKVSPKCDICDKVFAKKWMLNRHILTHSNELYKCIKCESTFKRIDYYRVHVRKCVGDTSEIPPNVSIVREHVDSGYQVYSMALCDEPEQYNSLDSGELKVIPSVAQRLKSTYADEEELDVDVSTALRDSTDPGENNGNYAIINGNLNSEHVESKANIELVHSSESIADCSYYDKERRDAEESNDTKNFNRNELEITPRFYGQGIQIGESSRLDRILSNVAPTIVNEKVDVEPTSKVKGNSRPKRKVTRKTKSQKRKKLVKMLSDMISFAELSNDNEEIEVIMSLIEERSLRNKLVLRLNNS